MIILKNYTLLKIGTLYHVVSETKQNCPICGGKLFVRDSRKFYNMALETRTI